MWNVLASCLVSASLAVSPGHPHVPRVVKVGLAQGDLTLSYFTVPFNAEHLTGVQPGFSWHAGFARLSTTRALDAGGKTIPPGEYKLNFHKTEGGWALELGAPRVMQALQKIAAAKRRKDDEQVATLQAALQKEIQQDGLVHLVVPFRMVEADEDEHLRIQVVTAGYVAVSRTDPTPTAGAELVVVADFGTLHGRVELTERFPADTASKPGMEKRD